MAAETVGRQTGALDIGPHLTQQRVAKIRLEQTACYIEDLVVGSRYMQTKTETFFNPCFAQFFRQQPPPVRK